MPLSIDYNSYGRAYNIWRDRCAEFRREYTDHRELNLVVETVLELLNHRLSDNGEDQFHPFRKYADADKTGLENFHALALDTMHALQEQRLRQYAHSFFHSGGVNYPEMLELLDDYLLFADRAEDPAWDGEEEDDETASESGSEDEESVIDLTGEPDDEPYFDANAPIQFPHLQG